WSTLYNQPTAELYHVTTDTRQPYRIYAAQQDNTTIAFDSRSPLGAITQLDTSEVGGGESGHIAVRPDNPDIVFAGSYKGWITRLDQATRERQPIDVWPDEPSSAEEARYRFNWTSPILLSPHDPGVLYYAGNRVFRTTDEGNTWTPISPDLTYADPEKLRSSGGITTDNSGAEFYCTVFALVESPLQQGLLWAGTDDGRVHVTRDGGSSWTEITPPDLPRWATVRTIDASTYGPGTAYVVAEAHKLDDFRPYVFRSRDFGSSWERLDRGLEDNEYCHVLREDPVRRGLLYLGTEIGLRVSFDDGSTWQPVGGALPQSPVHDLIFKGDDLIVATHGRSIWILEDLPALRQYQADQEEASLHLYRPRTQVRWLTDPSLAPRSETPRSYSHLGTVVIPFDKVPRPGRVETENRPVGAGTNPTDGVAILYQLRAPGDDELRITIVDGKGEEIRTLIARPGDEDRKPEKGKPQDPVPPRRPGLNRFVWDGRHGRGTQIEVDPPEDLETVENLGPLVPPGRYTVRVQLGGLQQQAEFEIAADPRSRASEELRRTQYQLGVRLWRRLSDLYGAVNRARTARSGLAGREDGKALAEALTELERELAMDGGGKDSMLTARSGLDTKLRLLRELVGEAPPTPSALQVADDLDHRLSAVLERLNPLLDQAQALHRRPDPGT
ncbi:MAG: glycosyl hydrolase, partial [Candidatus Dormibacteraeota bacterium]|nr:glycosyl hydrolase [Candidatus Dormibacteraeota bacterium]